MISLIKNNEDVLIVLKSFKDIIKNGCVIFTVIIIISYTIGMIISTETKAYIPSLKSVYIFLLFSILFSFANNLLHSRKLNNFTKLFLHFVITGALYFSVFVLGGALSQNGFMTIVLMSFYAFFYIIFAIIYLVFIKRKESKNNDLKQYNSLYK